MNQEIKILKEPSTPNQADLVYPNDDTHKSLIFERGWVRIQQANPIDKILTGQKDVCTLVYGEHPVDSHEGSSRKVLVTSPADLAKGSLLEAFVKQFASRQGFGKLLAIQQCQQKGGNPELTPAPGYEMNEVRELLTQGIQELRQKQRQLDLDMLSQDLSMSLSNLYGSEAGDLAVTAAIPNEPARYNLADDTIEVEFSFDQDYPEAEAQNGPITLLTNAIANLMQSKGLRLSRGSRSAWLSKACVFQMNNPDTNRIASPDTSETPRAVVLTALSLEYNAVKANLHGTLETVNEQGTVYEKGLFKKNERTWEVLIGQTGAGNSRAASEVERAINFFKPEVALFVGVAGGLKDVQLGDVVAATRVYGYESGKAKGGWWELLFSAQGGFRPRPDVGLSTYRLVSRAHAIERTGSWLPQVGTAETNPRAFVGPIAAGEKVVGNKRSAIAMFIQSEYGDALAVEMEGRGFLEATHANHIDAIVVRGISDLITKKEDADAEGWQPKAAANAASFAFQILAEFDPPIRIRRAPKDSSARRDIEQIKRLLINLPTQIMDYFFENARGEIINEDVLYFWEGFHSEMGSGSYDLSDSTLNGLLQTLHANLQVGLSFSDRLDWISSGKALKFQGFRSGNFEKWNSDHERFTKALSAAEIAYRTMLEYIKTKYREIDLRDLSRQALEERARFHSDETP